MSCNHKFMTSHLFDYLEGTLSAELSAQCETTLKNCQQCQQTYQQALELKHLSEQWQDQPVPQWHRNSFLVQPSKQATPWLGRSALLASGLTMLMVVFQLEVRVDDGLHITFGGSQQENRLLTLMEENLLNFQGERELYVETQLLQALERQSTNTQLLLSRWLELSRDERRDDLNFILSTWQTQRYQDRRQVDEQINYITSGQIENNQYVNALMQTANFSQGENL